ncbi:MAG TPA: ARMT1-like domain-containing protein [Polyangiaceae bacterium]|jgi:uncharacterized protein with ATP-grasp and redox domains
MKTRTETLSTPTRPEALRTDGSNEFAHFSMQVRVPKILDEVLERNPNFAPTVRRAVADLRDGIAGGARFPELAFPAPDAMEWESDSERRKGEGWLSSQWFFAECYVYRCLMAATRYFETGRDPFTPAKQAELDGEALYHTLETVLDAVAAEKPDMRLFMLLGASLWGNRADLSYAVGTAFGHQGTHDDLLCDDRSWVVQRLLSAQGDVHIVLDNAGSELAADLALAEAIVASTSARVTLHVKAHPTFVSDAVAADVWALLAALQGKSAVVRDLGQRFERAFFGGQLRIAPDGFWNGPRFLWDRPMRLARELDAAALVILKGDANYRRTTGDAMWPEKTTFTEATSYLPAPLVCLRTMKSDGLVGVGDARAAELDRADPKWRINGRRGLVQAKR